jgi:hypothetical protein
MNTIRIEEWPESLNDQAAMLGMEPSEISSRTALVFEQSFDALGDFFGCVARMGNGQIFALMRYIGNPVPGTIIVLEQGKYSPSLGVEQLNYILAELAVTAEDVIWLRQE